MQEARVLQILVYHTQSTNYTHGGSVRSRDRKGNGCSVLVSVCQSHVNDSTGCIFRGGQNSARGVQVLVGVEVVAEVVKLQSLGDTTTDQREMEVGHDGEQRMLFGIEYADMLTSPQR